MVADRAYLGLLITADFIMSRQMLRGVKARAERILEAEGRACREQASLLAREKPREGAAAAGSV